MSMSAAAFPALDQRAPAAASRRSASIPGARSKNASFMRWQNAPDSEAWRKEVDGVRRAGLQHRPRQLYRRRAIVAVPVLNARRTITHTIAAVGLVSQLDRATSVGLAHDMRWRRKPWRRSWLEGRWARHSSGADFSGPRASRSLMNHERARGSLGWTAPNGIDVPG